MGRTRVLVADDNETYGALLARFLSSQSDMEVVGCARDAGEAIRLASALRPDLVLMDVCMPGLDGIEATRILLAQRKDLRVISLTAHGTPEAERRSLEAGACAFVRKAEADQRLLEVIRDPGATNERGHGWVGDWAGRGRARTQ